MDLFRGRQKKSGRLEDQLDSARERISNLEQQLHTMTEGRTNVEENINTQFEEIKEMIGHLEGQELPAAQIEERLDTVKNEIFEKVHTENVACYRNMKSLVAELREDRNELELSEESLTQIRTSFKGLKFFSVFALLSFLLLIVILLIELGVIPV